MIILGIETSCDETAAAVLKKDQNGIHILSNVVASSAKLQAKYGGIIPEQAAREQIKSIIPVIEEALKQAQSTRGVKSTNPAGFIDAIAVTYGPGLIGSLLVGVETAKTLAKIWSKPLIPVNHLIGHFYANWIAPSVISESEASRESININKLLDPLPTFSVGLRGDDKNAVPKFPCLGLLVSGGHTDLVLFENHGKYKYLGGTRDDAAGECFDKCARLLGLPYPGGSQISKLAQKGNPQTFDLPRPMIDSKDWDFSFSGLKTAVANLIHTSGESPSLPLGTGKPTPEVKCNLAASIEQAIVDVLITKTITAAQTYHINQIMIAGGVAANKRLASELKLKIVNCKLKINLHLPGANLCTDNAAMIAAAAFFQKPIKNPLSLQTDPNLALSD